MSGGAQKRNLTAGKMVSYAWNKLGVWLVFIILFILLAFANEKFLLPANLINVVRQICVNAVVALGATYVVLCGEIDLSQSSLAVLAGCGCAMLIMRAGMNIYLAMVISLAAGTVVGALMGLIVTKLRVQSFIATLGMLVANPIPEQYAMDADYINGKIDEAVADAERRGVKGKEITPFLLDAIQKITGGESLEANIRLVFNNAVAASNIAVELAKLK